MKKLFAFIKDNQRQLLEILILIIVTLIPFFMNFNELFKVYLENNPVAPANFIWNLAIMIGNYALSLVFFCIVLWKIRKFNDDFVMNRMRVYHDYSYLWYWFCSKVLGINKCSLVLVPIYMQYKLVIRATFKDYPLDDEDYPVIPNEFEPKVKITNSEATMDEINIIIEDTYPIDKSQIPESKQKLYTVRVSRNDGKNQARYFSQNLIRVTINVVRIIEKPAIFNIYATTNPKNTLHIASQAFALGDRGNIRHLYVFQQNVAGKRKFEEKGNKIY